MTVRRVVDGQAAGEKRDVVVRFVALIDIAVMYDKAKAFGRLDQVAFYRSGSEGYLGTVCGSPTGVIMYGS